MKKLIAQSHSKQLLLLGLIVCMGIFLINFTSALDFDNNLKYEVMDKGQSFYLGEKQLEYNNLWEKYSPIEIKNWLGFGEVLFKGALTKHTDVCSSNCESEVEIYLPKDDVLIDEMIWERSFDNGESWVKWNSFVNWKVMIENKNRYIQQPTYETQCLETGKISLNGTKEVKCSQVQIGTQTIDSGEFIPYQIGEEVKAGNYKIQIIGSKKGSTLLDWKIKTQGKILDKLAVWGSIAGGDDAEVILNAPTDEEVMLTNLVTTNASANVTGGASLVNATLYDNATGTWGARNITLFSTAMSITNLVSYYTLDETSGTTAIDSMGKTNLTNAGADVLAGGKLGSAYTFGGDDELARFLVDWSNDYSICMWANTTTTEWDNLIYSTNGAEETRFRISNINKLQLSSINGPQLGNNGTVINDGIYHFLCFKRESNVEYLYQDGIELHRLATTSNGGVRNVTIGGTDTETWVGNIDEVGIWNKSLTQSEIATLYNSGAGSRPMSGLTNNTVTFTNTYPAGSNILWNMQFCDSDGDCGFATANRTFSIDGTAPTITLNYPTSLLDYGRINGTLQLNITATDTNLDSVWYNYNGTNVTLTGTISGVYNISNITLSSKKNVTIYALDGTGNLNTSLFSWDYKFLENSQTFSNVSTVGAIENFIINATIASGYDLTTVILIYGNITLYPNIVSSGNNRIISVSNYEIPFYAVDTNVSFHWIILMNDTTTFNTSVRTMLVSPVLLDNCSTHTYQILNISLFDEATKTPINGDIELSYSVLNSETYSTINTLYYKATGINSTLVCSAINISAEDLVYSAEIRYEADGYASELYNIQRAAITPSGQNINLYDLNSSDSTSFKTIYQDSTFNFVEGAIVQLQRKYISEGTYQTVEAPLTSNQGVSILHIDLNSILYRATVVKNGIVLDEFDNIVFKCQSELTGECEHKLLGKINPENDINLDITRDFVYSIDKNGSIITLSFSIPSGSPSNVNILLVQKDQFGDSYTCNNTILSSAGSVQCTISETLGDSYIDLSIFKNGYPMATLSYIVAEDRGLDWLGNNYIFIIILLFSLMGMALSSPEWIVINAIIVIVISGALYLANGLDFVMGLGNIVWLIIAAIILISKISKQEDR